MPNLKELKESSEGVEIQFGTKILPKEEFRVGNPDRIDVIVELGKNKWFETGTLFTDKDGKQRVFVGGTGDVEYIKEVIGVMDAMELIQAIKTDFERRYGGKYPEELLEDLQLEAKREPRILKI
jgi:hypothetical protein